MVENMIYIRFLIVSIICKANKNGTLVIVVLKLKKHEQPKMKYRQKTKVMAKKVLKKTGSIWVRL